MKRTGPIPFDKIIDLWVSDNPNLKKKLLEAKVTYAWKEQMGKGIELQTKEIYLNGKTLIVHLKSAILRNELNMRRQIILNMLREELGDDAPERILLK